MNMQHDNSFLILTLAAIGLLASAMIKGLSPESSLQLADSASGRIVLDRALFTEEGIYQLLTEATLTDQMTFRISGQGLAAMPE